MFENKTEAQAREEILSMVAEYAEKFHNQKKEFKEGDRIPYASRVYDKNEMVNLVDSSLEFWLTSGRYTDEFEKKLADYLNVRFCSLVNSGSSANLVAFMALTSPLLGERRIKRGDEIITVACGFPTTVAPAIQYGAVPVFVDVKIPQYNIDVTKLEDALSDKAYFDAVYKEAVELTAYLCTLYGLSPQGTANLNGVTVPVILCHADSHKLGLGSNHGDVLHWFKKYGKTMDDVREDVAALMGADIEDSTPTPVAPAPQMYRVRKSWADAASQKGAYTNLNNAKKMCDQCGNGYFVYDAKGIQVYPNKIETTPVTPTPSNDLKVGDKIQLVNGATYASGKSIPAWVFKSVLYCREIRKDGTVVFSTLKEGAVTGVIKKTSIKGYESGGSATTTNYKVKITADVLNVRKGPATSYAITCRVKKNEVYTIVGEVNGWGKLKSGAGYISLAYTKKL